MSILWHRTLAALIIVVLFSVVGPSQAIAGADGPTLCTSGACVWFTQNGDEIHVQDTKCDGHSAVAQVQIATTGTHNNLYNSDGCGTVRKYVYGDAVPEGSVVYYRPCIG